MKGFITFQIAPVRKIWFRREAWDIFTGSLDVMVAVIDTGVDYNYVDLVDNRWINVGEIADNGVDDDG
ncbi:MAG: hypothetical protein ABFS56_14270 [Pseudomonadota bacterium]